MRHEVESAVVTRMSAPPYLPEVRVTMKSGSVWTFRQGLAGRTHLMASTHTSRHPEYSRAREAARRALISQ